MTDYRKVFLAPALTRFRLSLGELGGKLGEHLVAALDAKAAGKRPPMLQTIWPLELVPGDSVGPADFRTALPDPFGVAGAQPESGDGTASPARVARTPADARDYMIKGPGAPQEHAAVGASTVRAIEAACYLAKRCLGNDLFR